MAIPASKDALLSAISINFDKLMDDLLRIPESRVYEYSMEGHQAGTRICPANLVSYLLGWNELVLKWLRQDDKGEPIDFPETGFQWNQLGLLAQKFYADYQSLRWDELMKRLMEVKAELIKTISNRSNEELYGVSWVGKWTKGRMIQLNTSSPYSNARGRIRKWLRT